METPLQREDRATQREGHESWHLSPQTARCDDCEESGQKDAEGTDMRRKTQPMSLRPPPPDPTHSPQMWAEGTDEDGAGTGRILCTQAPVSRAWPPPNSSQNPFSEVLSQVQVPCAQWDGRQSVRNQKSPTGSNPSSS